MKIKEIIVVEGKSDTIAIKRATGADTIETNGSAIDERTLNRIRLAQETRGVIVFTDPDFPGRRIRSIIEERIPGVKHAFLHKSKTIAKNGQGLGIEHAKDEDIEKHLEAVYSIDERTNRGDSIWHAIGSKAYRSSRRKKQTRPVERTITNRASERQRFEKET